jgi:PAS domain S-box-containing protein
MEDTTKTQQELLAELGALPTPPGSGNQRGAPGEASERLDHALECLRAAMVEIGKDGRNLYVSPSLSTLLGYDPAEVLHRKGWTLVHQEDRPTLIEMSRKLEATEQPVRGVFRSLHKSGHWVWLEATSAYFHTSDGERRTITFARDVTDVKAADEALRSSENRFRMLAENASDLIIELDADGRYLFVSPNCEQILGIRAEELTGHTLEEDVVSHQVHASDRSELEQAFTRNVATGQSSTEREHRLLHADGTWHWFDSRFKSYSTREGEWRAVVISRDVTERRRVREELRESEERYRVITQTTKETIAEVDAEGRLTYVSPASLAVLGFRPEELVGISPTMLVHPDDAERCAKIFLEGVETGGLTKTGPYRFRCKDGSWRWLDSQGISYRRVDGALRYLFTSHDVTDHLRAEEEERELEERMQQAQRLEGLGVMAGGIAHDFNNLLTPILGDASLVLMDLPPDSPLRPRLQKIQKAARRAAALTNQMLAYAGKGPLVVEQLDLSALVREMAQLLETSVARKAELVYELDGNLAPLEGDAAQLSQVVMNLLTNAAEAVGESGGRIAVRTGAFQARPQARGRSWLGENLPEGPAVYIEVEDNGCGMDEETLGRIFDPFFTTKFTGRGLGLAAALGIVRGHRGAIELESAPAKGTRFRVMFPTSITA